MALPTDKAPASLSRMERLRRFVKKRRLPEEDDDLETVIERKGRWRSIYVIYFTMFLMSLGFSIILTGVWPYLDGLDKGAGKIFMGLVVAANPLGQMLFSPLVGWWSNKLGSVRLPLIATLGLFTVSSAMYSSLEMLPGSPKYNMIVARFLVGISSANIAAARSYISAATKISERTKAVSMVSLAQVLGFVFGPGLQTAVTPLGANGFYLFDWIPINMYTAAGWINVFLGIINVLLFLPGVFTEYKIATREAMLQTGMKTEVEAWKQIKPDYVASWSLIAAFYVMVFNFVLLETLGTSLTMDQFAWSKEEAMFYMGLLMSIGALVACLAFVMINPLCKRFEERRVMIWGGFLFMVIGRIIMIPWGPDPPIIADIVPDNFTNIHNRTDVLGCPSTQEWCKYTPAMTVTQFIIGYGFTTVGYPLGVTLIQTIFSKILGARPQGVWMGLMTGVGCASRVMGPLFVGFIYTKYGTYHTFGITGVMLILSMVWLSIVDKRLIPPLVEKKSKLVPGDDGQKDIELPLIRVLSDSSTPNKIQANVQSESSNGKLLVHTTGIKS